MKITADTNVLLRALVRDDEAQAHAAEALLRSAEIIAIPLPCACELVWVLRRVYEFRPEEIGAALRALLDTQNVVLNRPAVEAGLRVLAAGGDFADGAIAYEGAWMGGETFVSFDRKAVRLLAQQGMKTLIAGGTST
jgi:predicted nucleic-acid-binding protein